MTISNKIIGLEEEHQGWTWWPIGWWKPWREALGTTQVARQWGVKKRNKWMIESSNQRESRRKMIGWLKLKWQGLGNWVVEQLKAQGNKYQEEKY
jgi:hypothetical protein